MANNKVQLADGTVLLDLTGDTVDAEHLMQGYTAHDKSGAAIVGTATGGDEVDMYAGKTAPSGAQTGDLWVDTSDEPSGKAVQISNNSGRHTGINYTEISGVSLTVNKSGTYDVYWSGFRSTTSGTYGTQLYVGNSAPGTQQTIFSNHEQHPYLSNVPLNANDVLTIRGRSASSNNYIYVSNLIIIEVGD